MNTEGKYTLCAKDTYHCVQIYSYLFPHLDVFYMGDDYTADVIAISW